MGSTEFAVIAESLRKRYGDTNALDGFDLRVPQGKVCGLLGPNGAGKTTAVRILSTLVRLDQGRASVAGFDVATQADHVRHNIGLVGQYAAVDEILSGRQNLQMFGRLYHLPPHQARLRSDEMLERFRLTDTGKKAVKSYSGGMRRRLDLAASMILAPAVLFLDEPTTGLDPRSRNEVWQAVRELTTLGTTVILTTQYLDEADQLADQIAVIDAGRVIADGTPDELKAKLGGDRIDVTVRTQSELATTAAIATRIGGDTTTDEDSRKVSVAVEDRAVALTSFLSELAARGVEVDDIGLRRPTLDEVFLRLTGTDSVRDEQQQPDDGKPYLEALT